MTHAAPSSESLSPLAALGAVAVVMGASAIVAMRNSPDPLHPRIRRWYKRLDKPDFTPPDPVFGAVWPVLESGLALGGYRLLRQPSGPSRNTAVGLWLVTTAMVGGWTQLFFGKKKLGASAVASGVMLATGAGYVAAAAKVDRPAAAAAIPFVAWLGFATLLAEQVWRRNAPGPTKDNTFRERFIDSAPSVKYESYASGRVNVSAGPSETFHLPNWATRIS